MKVEQSNQTNHTGWRFCTFPILLADCQGETGVT